MKKVYIAADHAGFELKKLLIDNLRKKEIETSDLGCYTEDSVDYPDYAKVLAEELKANPSSFGVLICGSGIGMCIAANRFDHIRAALCDNVQSSILAREHNNANVIVLGSRITSPNLALDCLENFLNSEYSNEQRHNIRLDKLNKIREV